MARKPAHLQASGALTPRERIWAAVRRLKRFTAREIEGKTRLPDGTIQTYIEGLAAAGYIAPAGREKGLQRGAKGKYVKGAWRLVTDCGIEAPRVTRAGREVTQGRVTLYLWRAMRMLRRFDHRSLAMAASTDEVAIRWATAKSYVGALARAGYLNTEVPAKPGVPAIHSLRCNTGPKPPQIQRVKRIWDPNLGRAIESKESWT